MRRPAIAVLVAAAVALPAAAAVRAQQPCAANRLANGGFESGFTMRSRADEVVAAGWEPWFEALPGVGGINYAPRFEPRRLGRDGPLAVADGLWSQELGTAASTHIGGLYQTVATGDDVLVAVRALAYAWSGGGRPETSAPPGFYRASLGLDPLGGADPHATRIIWSAPVTVTGAWRELRLEAAVEGPGTTLFLKGEATKVLARHAARWDAVCLTVVGAVGAPTATATLVPRPTRTAPPGSPTPTPNEATRSAQGALILADLFATATARAVREQTVEPSQEPAAGAAGPTPAESPTGVAAHAGLLFLGLGSLLAGLLLSGARSGRRPGRPGGGGREGGV